MIIYNVTVSIDASVEQEWLSWMRSKHIPDVMSTKAFRECKLSRLMTGEEQGGRAYSIMYTAFSSEHLAQYQKVHAVSDFKKSTLENTRVNLRPSERN